MANEPRSDIAFNKLAYDNVEGARGYERMRFSGVLGKSRDARERRASHCAIQQFMRDSTVLDCPCGTGRWFERLAFRASRIIGVDIAKEMLAVARERRVPGVEIELYEGDVEHLELEDEAVEHVFCFALMKHLPDDIKRAALRELARVSSGRLAVSFCLTNPASRALWQARGSRGYPNTRAELDDLAAAAGLRVGAIYPVGVPVLGLEAIVVLERDT